MTGVGIAMRELRRRPGRFAPVVAVLALLAVLSILFGGLLDGLALGATAALRELPADLVVLDRNARSQIDRSRVPDDVRAQVAAVDGVAETGALAYVRLAAGDAGHVALLAAEHRPPAVAADLGDGAAIDAALEARGVAAGDHLALGDIDVEIVEADGLVGLGLGGTVWVEPERWRELVAEVRPDLAPMGPFAVRADLTRVPEAWPALTVRVDDGADATAVAAAIDETVGVTQTLTVAEAVAAIPGTKREARVFSGLISVTVVVACVVVALFLGLATIEQKPLLSTLRAVGVRTGGLAVGLIAQALVVVLVAFAVAGLIVVHVVPLLPPTVPVLVLPARLGAVATALLVAAGVGALGSVRRVWRADPAAAMS